MLTYPRSATLGENLRVARASAKGAIGPGVVISLPNRPNTSRPDEAQRGSQEARGGRCCRPLPLAQIFAGKTFVGVEASDGPAGEVGTRCFSPLAAFRSLRKGQRGIDPL